jgi:hypothetical protein
MITANSTLSFWCNAPCWDFFQYMLSICTVFLYGCCLLAQWSVWTLCQASLLTWLCNRYMQEGPEVSWPSNIRAFCMAFLYEKLSEGVRGKFKAHLCLPEGIHFKFCVTGCCLDLSVNPLTTYSGQFNQHSIWLHLSTTWVPQTYVSASGNNVQLSSISKKMELSKIGSLSCWIENMKEFHIF